MKRGPGLRIYHEQSLGRRVLAGTDVPFHAATKRYKGLLAGFAGA